MKSTVAIFLLLLLASIQTPLGQVFKFPLLIEHFIKHQKQNGVSFLGFLTDHYATGHSDSDLPEDEQLPFKNITFQSIGYAIVATFIQPSLFVPLSPDKKVGFPGFYSAQQHLARIFHPPRGYLPLNS